MTSYELKSIAVNGCFEYKIKKRLRCNGGISAKKGVRITKKVINIDVSLYLTSA